jgi:hypothetical protein
MHGDERLERFRKILNKKYGLDVATHDCSVRYRFGGGEKKRATKCDVLTVGIGVANGEISSNRIPDSPTKMLLSLQTQISLGMVLDLAAGKADFKALGLYNMKLRKTSEGGWGVRIADFAPGRFVHVPPEEQETVVSEDVVVYEAVEEKLPTVEEQSPGLPLHEVPRKCTTAGNGKTLRTEQEQMLEQEEGVWAAVRGERRGRWTRDRLVNEASRRLRPGQTFMKELFCGTLMMTWAAATLFQLPVWQPDDLLDGSTTASEREPGQGHATVGAGRPVDHGHRLAMWTMGQLGQVSTWTRRHWCREHHPKASRSTSFVEVLGEGGAAPS